MIAAPIWDAVAADHAALDTDWTIARHAADLALWPFGTWREQTRTAPIGSALDALIPQRRPLPAAARPLTAEGSSC